jgi:hypothetical protein
MCYCAWLLVMTLPFYVISVSWISYFALLFWNRQFFLGVHRNAIFARNLKLNSYYFFPSGVIECRMRQQYPRPLLFKNNFWGSRCVDRLASTPLTLQPYNLFWKNNFSRFVVSLLHFNFSKSVPGSVKAVFKAWEQRLETSGVLHLFLSTLEIFVVIIFRQRFCLKTTSFWI